MIDLKNCEIKDIVSYFLGEVNNLVFKPQKIAEEQKHSSEMRDLDLYWIKAVSSNTYMTDLRNEASAKTGRKLVAIPFVAGKLEHCNNPKMAEVAEKMSRQHRSIQQTFSKLIFCHFMLICNSREQQILCDVMGEEFYRLPLI